MRKVLGEHLARSPPGSTHLHQGSAGGRLDQAEGSGPPFSPRVPAFHWVGIILTPPVDSKAGMRGSHAECAHTHICPMEHRGPLCACGACGTFAVHTH